MDINNYIESGILESYALGVATPQEMQEVLCLSKIYPEIKEELISLQVSLEDYALSLQTPPPKDLKGKVLRAVSKETQEVSLDTKKAKIVSMPNNGTGNKKGVSKLYKYSLVASLALILCLAGVFLVEQNKNERLASSIKDAELKLDSANLKYSNLTDEFEEQLASLYTTQEVILDKATKQIILNGTPISPTSTINVYWNNNLKQAVVANNQLPKVTEGKQYQLWAIANGKPVDLGVINKDNSSINTVNNIPVNNIDAFAITLEPNGGSEDPTMENLMVVGKV